MEPDGNHSDAELGSGPEAVTVDKARSAQEERRSITRSRELEPCT